MFFEIMTLLNELKSLIFYFILINRLKILLWYLRTVAVSFSFALTLFRKSFYKSSGSLLDVLPDKNLHFDSSNLEQNDIDDIRMSLEYKRNYDIMS